MAVKLCDNLLPGSTMPVTYQQLSFLAGSAWRDLMAYKILTVDDSKTIRMIVKKAFMPFNCEMFEGENGVEGLAIANKEKPDLIILDITMPVMTGIEMLEKLKTEKELKDIPVIMLTAESGKDNVMKIVKMGVRDYMVKPFKGDQLIERAKTILKLAPKPS
jgi:DNA-binding response OmpR family regulator